MYFGNCPSVNHCFPYSPGATSAWLDYYAIPIERVHMGADNILVAAQEKLDMMIEDHPAIAFNLAEASIPVLLLDAKYNRSANHPRIRRCRGWSEVVSFVLDRSTPDSATAV